jgi:hypothetical protein
MLSSIHIWSYHFNWRYLLAYGKQITSLVGNKNKFIVYPFGDYTLPGYNQCRSKRFAIGSAK